MSARTTMNKFFANALASLIGTAMFAAVGVGMARAHHVNVNDGYGISWKV